MLSSITLDDANGTPIILHDEASGKRGIERALGFAGIGSLRDDRRVRPQSHGGIDTTRWEDGRLMVIEGAVWSQLGQDDAWAEWDAIVSPMLETLDVGPALIKWTRADGVELQRYVRLASEVDPEISEGAAMLRYQAQFYAEDPRAYSQTLQTVTGEEIFATGTSTVPLILPITFAPSGGGTVAVNNAGTRPTPFIGRIYGYAAGSVSLTLVDDGRKIALSGDIAPGDYVEIDTQAKTLKLNGTSPVQDLLDSANTQWFELPKGASTLQLAAGANDTVTRTDVLLRSAY